jgi:hypothetical protein
MKPKAMFPFGAVLVAILLLAACAPAAVTPAAMPATQAIAPTLPADAAPTSTSASAAAPVAGNCAILPTAEVASVLGEAVAEVRDEAKHTICAYQTASFILEVNFLNTGGVSADQYMQNVRATKDNPTTVAGLGDDAFDNGSTTYPILLVRKGDAVYTFGLRSSDSALQISIPLAEVQAKEFVLAGMMLSHLP